MNRFLIALAALAATSAMAADPAAQPATPPASTATADSCTLERVTTMVVNGKTVEIRKREPNPDPRCHPQAKRLWD